MITLTGLWRSVRTLLAASPAPTPPFDPYYLRQVLTAEYIRGQGLEIGALHKPLPVSPGTVVKYVDRYDVAGLRAHYPELAAEPLVPIDIIDNGERLETIADGSQDFVIANHFLEHTQNPIGTLRRLLQVLKRGGLLYLAVPDKRGTFDQKRPLTLWDHLDHDDVHGPQASRESHFREWVQLVDNVTGEAVEPKVAELMQKDYSIHFHVWTHDSFIEFLHEVRLKKQLPMTLQAVLFNRHLSETITILKRT